MTLAEKMILYRAKHKMSQGKLAELCGLNRSTIKYIESGKKEPLKTTAIRILCVVEKQEEK